MQTLFTTRKIVSLALMASFALMTALFIFHLRDNGNIKKSLSNDEVMIFPIGRDIKPFQLENANGHAFSQKDLANHWTLLLFGFAHCNTVCPLSLAMLKKVYGPLHAMMPNLQVVLVSIDPDRDNKKELNDYVKQFNSLFIGVSGKHSALRKLESNLGIYALFDPQTASNYQIQHSSSILLISPEVKWVAIFKYGMSPNDFQHAFTHTISFLSDGKLYV